MAQNGAYFTYIEHVSGSSVLGQTPMGAYHSTLSGTAAQHRVTDRSTPGDLKNFYANVLTNANPNSVTVAVRKNGSIGNLSISVPASTTGLLSDLTGTDSIADGDTFNHTVSIGASGAAFSVLCGVQYETTGQFAFQPAGGIAAGFNLSAASTASYAQTLGLLSPTTSESQRRFAALGAITLSKMQVYASANARSTSTTVASRNNGVDGNQAITITAGATGLFEDTTNSDSVADGEYYCVEFTTGTGTGNLTLRYASFRIETSVENWCPVYGSTGFALAAAATTQRAFVNNTLTGGAPVPYGARAAQLYVSVTANTVTASSTLTLRVNGTGTAVAATVPASTTGRFIDSTDTAPLAAGDLIDVEIAAGSTGTTLTVREYGLLIDAYKTIDNTGTLVAGAATMTGDLEVGHATSGALAAGSATMSGAITVVHTLTGALQAGAATITGALAIPASEITLTGDLQAGSATMAGILTVGDPLAPLDEFYILGGFYNLRIAHPDPGLIVQLQTEVLDTGTWIDVSIPVIGDYDTHLELPPGNYRFVSNVVGSVTKSLVPIFRRGPL